MQQLFFQGKRLILTRLAASELEASRKNISKVLDILERGTHQQESMEKMISKLKSKKGCWEVVYAEYEYDIIVVHFKFVR